MDWPALGLSLQLATWTTILLIPLGIMIARVLAWRSFVAKGVVEGLVVLPLVLPPTVLGFYLLETLGKGAWLGQLFEALFDRPLAFTFEALLLASIIFNLPFAVQPAQRAFENIGRDLREAAWCSGMSTWRTFWRIELPLAWPGILTATILTFFHTIGEFGVVLMVGGNIPGETQTIAIAIYDNVQAFNDRAAGVMSALLLLMSFVVIGMVYLLNHRRDRWRR